MIMFKTLKWTHFVTAQSRLPGDATWRQCGFAKEGGTVILRQFAMFALNFFLYDHQATNRTTANNQQIKKRSLCHHLIIIISHVSHLNFSVKTHWLGILHVFAIHSMRNPVPSFYICLLDSGWRQISFVHIAGGGGADEKVISQLYNLGRLCSEMEKAADAADTSVLFFSAGANF